MKSNGVDVKWDEEENSVKEVIIEVAPSDLMSEGEGGQQPEATVSEDGEEEEAEEEGDKSAEQEKG